jgi:hypothetical protein
MVQIEAINENLKFLNKPAWELGFRAGFPVVGKIRYYSAVVDTRRAMAYNKLVSLNFPL